MQTSALLAALALALGLVAQPGLSFTPFPSFPSLGRVPGSPQTSSGTGQPQLLPALSPASMSFSTTVSPVRPLGASKTVEAEAEAALSEPATEELEKIAGQWVQCAQNGVSLRAKSQDYLEETYDVRVSRDGGLGLILAEMIQFGDQNRGLVLVEEIVAGSNAEAAGKIRVGDSIMAVQGNGEAVDVQGLDWDSTVGALTSVSGDSILLTMKRMIKRATVKVTVTAGDGSNLGSFECASGANLRMEFLRRTLPKEEIYDSSTMRFDAIGNAGSNCGGEGTCGTCIVAFTQGLDLVSPAGRVEGKALAKQNRPVRWRWSCRAQLGYDNKGGDISVQLKPQLAFGDEQNKQVGL